MKRSFQKLLFAAAVASFFGSVLAQSTFSEDAARHSAQAGSHALASAGHSVAASGRATLAVSAVPLAIGGAVLVLGSVAAVGSVGASAASARGSAQAANAPIGTPLQITDETITVIAPNVALKPKDEPKTR